MTISRQYVVPKVDEVSSTKVNGSYVIIIIVLPWKIVQINSYRRKIMRIYTSVPFGNCYQLKFSGVERSKVLERRLGPKKSGDSWRSQSKKQSRKPDNNNQHQFINSAIYLKIADITTVLVISSFFQLSVYLYYENNWADRN